MLWLQHSWPMQRRPISLVGGRAPRAAAPKRAAVAPPRAWFGLRTAEWAVLAVALVTIAMVALLFERARVPALAMGGAIAAIVLRVALLRSVPEARGGGSGLPFSKARALLRKMR